MGFAYNQIEGTYAVTQPGEQANGLLRRDETLPRKVQESLDLLEAIEAWYIISRNDITSSCRDAASRRNRLGAQGIPLGDELKTMAAVYYDCVGQRHLALFHCRGNRQFDLEGISKMLKASRPIAKMSHDELEHTLEAGYGTVNPFNVPANLLQIFDHGIFLSDKPPHTMMTNGGERSWAIEFRVKEFVEKLAEARPGRIQIADLTERIPQMSQACPKFGIITGNGPDSGMTLWRHLNRSVATGLGKDFRGDLSYPEVVIRSIPEMGLSMELAPRENEAWHYLSQAISGHCRDGCTHIALACHTTHYFSPQIRDLCKGQAEFVSMAEVTMKFIHDQKIKNLTIMGIPYVSDLGPWSAYRSLIDLPANVLGKSAREPMLELGYLIKRIQKEKDKLLALNKLHHVLRVGVEKEDEHVLIALTEISVLLESFPKHQARIGHYPIIDPLKLYGDALARICLSQCCFE